MEISPRQRVGNKEPLLQAAGGGGREDSWGSWTQTAQPEKLLLSKLGQIPPGVSTPAAPRQSLAETLGGESSKWGATKKMHPDQAAARSWRSGSAAPGTQAPEASDSPAPARRLPNPAGPTHLDQAATLLPQGALQGLGFRWAPQAGTHGDTETSLLHPGTRQHVTDSRALPV